MLLLTSSHVICNCCLELQSKCVLNVARIGTKLTTEATHRPSEVCGVNEWRCDNNQCINVEFFCDGTDDCTDNSDEGEICAHHQPTGKKCCLARHHVYFEEAVRLFSLGSKSSEHYLVFALFDVVVICLLQLMCCTYICYVKMLFICIFPSNFIVCHFLRNQIFVYCTPRMYCSC